MQSLILNNPLLPVLGMMFLVSALHIRRMLND